MNRYAAILPNGTRVLSAYPGSGAVPCVQFGGVTRTLPDYLLYPTAGLVGGRECVAGVYQDRAALLWGDAGALEVYGVTLGPYSVYVDEAGIVSWVRSPDGAVVLYSDGRTPTPSRDTQHPRFRDPLGRATWAGVTVVPLGASGPWALGEEASTPDGVTRLVAWDGAALKLAYDGYTSLPATLQASGSACTVAISLPSDAATFFVEPSAFKPYTPYVPPAAVIPTFPPCSHLLSIGYAFEPHPVDWCEWCVLDVDDWDVSVQKAKDRHVPIVGDWDEEGEVFDFRVFEQFRGKCGKLRVIPALRFYPLPGETTAQSAARWEPFAEHASIVYPGNWGYVFAIYTQNGRLPVQQVVDGVRAAYGLALKHRARQADGFAWDRADGVTAYPEFQEVARRLYAAVPTDRLYPRQPDASVPPDPPKPEPPDPPKPKPRPFPLEVLMDSSKPSPAPVRNKFRPSVTLPGRHLIELANGKILGARFAAGGKNAFGTFEYYEAEPHEDNASTAWLWNEGDLHAFIWSDTHQAACVLVFDPKKYPNA